MYLYCCIWYNTWCWTYQVNWEHTRMVFIWSRFLLLVLVDRSNFCQGQFRLCKMKSVSVVEVYTTNFSCTLMSIEEMYCNEFPKPSCQQHLFEIFLFRFHFVSTLQYPVKQTALLYLKLPFQPATNTKIIYFVIFGRIRLCLF